MMRAIRRFVDVCYQEKLKAKDLNDFKKMMEDASIEKLEIIQKDSSCTRVVAN